MSKKAPRTFRDDLLDGGVRHALYKDPKNPEIHYRVIGLQVDSKTRQCFVRTTPFKGFTKKRRLIDCLGDERYFVKSCI